MTRKIYLEDLEFLNHIWLQKFSNNDKDNFNSFIKLLRRDRPYITTYKLAKSLNRSYMTVYGWRRGLRVPKLAQWSEVCLKCGKPTKDHKWLWLDQGLAIKPLGRPIEVPSMINSWKDTKYVIDQLKQNTDTEIPLTKYECFSFILGMIVGDAGKLSSDRDRLDLQLSKKYETNRDLGEFFCKCLNKLGIKAHRIKDTKNKFRWISQSSQIFNWIYKIVLGLENAQITTYNSVNAIWLLTSPAEIKRRFLQGIFESDGSVLYDSRITCAASPNTNLIQSLLGEFGIKSYVIDDNGWKVIKIEGFSNLNRSYGILFAPEIRTRRFQILEKLVNSNRNNSNKTPDIIKDKVISLHNKGLKNYQISKRLLIKYNYNLSRKSIQRITRR